MKADVPNRQSKFDGRPIKRASEGSIRMLAFAVAGTAIVKMNLLFFVLLLKLKKFGERPLLPSCQARLMD